MAWVLTRNVVKLREEFNELGPNRDKASDGSVGDLNHQTSSSGHNPDRTGNAEYKDGDSKDEVRAVDIDHTGPWLWGQSMEKAVQHLVLRGRSGAYVPLRYIIYKGRIWRKTQGWITQTYTGANSHDKHAHFSGDYTQAADENDTYDYGIAHLGEPDVTKTEFMNWIDEYFNSAAGRQAIASAVATTDNVVSLEWPLAQADAGLQSLIRFPKGGYAQSAMENAIAAKAEATAAKTTAAEAKSLALDTKTAVENVSVKVDEILTAVTGTGQ